MSRRSAHKYDHEAGAPLAQVPPVGQRVMINIWGYDYPYIRDDDGWRNEGMDNYLHEDLENYSFDYLDTLCDREGHVFMDDVFENHQNQCNRCLKWI